MTSLVRSMTRLLLTPQHGFPAFCPGWNSMVESLDSSLSPPRMPFPGAQYLIRRLADSMHSPDREMNRSVVAYTSDARKVT